MDAATQATLISKLEASDYLSMHKLFSDYLRPLSVLSSKSQNTKKESNERQDSSLIRPLAKTFLPFLSRVLSLLPKCLSESPKQSITEQFSAELLETYDLCLECLDLISSQLAGKFYAIHIQKSRFIHCLEYWNRYEEAVTEGFRVLKCLRGIQSEGDDSDSSTERFVPYLDKSGGVDDELAYLIVDIVVMVVRCVCLSRTREAGKYQDLLSLLKEVKPWFSVLDSSTSKKFYRVLLTYLSKATMFLVREMESFGGDLLAEFSATTFDEYAEFLDKCPEDIAPFALILKLYGLGLHISDCCIQSSGSCSTTLSSSLDLSAIRLLLDCQDKLQDLSVLFGSNGDHWCNDVKNNSESLSCRCKDSVGNICSDVEFDSKASQGRIQENKNVYLSFYLKALQFFCWPLAEFVYSERKRIVAEEAGSPLENSLRLIQDAFLQFCDTFFHCHSCTCEEERECLEEIDKTFLDIFVAAFTLSLKLNLNKKKSKKFMKLLLSDRCIRPQGLKFLIARLHNVGVDWYRNKQLKEASEALNLCCRASWTVLCQMFASTVRGDDSELFVKNIVDFASEASAKSSFLLDILFQIGSHNLDKVIAFSLEKWSVARNLFEKLPCPATLVKQWVKIQCKSFKNADTEASGRTLDTYLSSSYASQDTVGTILEQELLSYQEMSGWLPKFCQRMQMKVINILLQDLYVTKNSRFQRAGVLITKGRVLRACGSEGLKDCVQCLSEAIDTIDDCYGEAHWEATPVSHQLAVAYCLRALCIHEADPNSKQVFDDIHAGLRIWLKTNVPDRSPYAQGDMGCEHMLFLLYHVLDLLSMMGNLSFHSDIYGLMLKLFNRMDISSEKCLLILWEFRRLSHALCVSPISEEFIKNLSKPYYDDFKSIDFWMSCMKDSRPLLVGFRQNFSYLSSYFPLAFHSKDHSLQSDVMVAEVNEIVAHLISTVPVPSCSAFLAGHLCYDLSERYFYTGQLVEALYCAKEAHRLRSKLLQEHFEYLFEHMKPKYSETGEVIHKQPFCVSYFRVCNREAAKVWPSNAVSWDSDGCILTPWNVLQCYLESTLQVGVIHETIGNGMEAEALFHLGKAISCLQGLPLLTVVFSSALGKVYRKRHLLDLAEKELQNAKQVLAEGSMSITCFRCWLILDSTINEQLGHLCRSHLNCTTKGSTLELSYAENLYQSSLRRLNSFEWKNHSKGCEVAKNDQVAIGAGFEGFLLRFEEPLAKANTLKSRKTKKASISLEHIKVSTTVQNLRITRSRNRSSQSNVVGSLERIQPHSDGNINLHGKLTGEVVNICNKISCRKCSLTEIAKSGSLEYFIHMKWEFARRLQLLRLLMGLGKCQESCVEIHESHEIYSQCITILVGGDPFCDCYQFGSRPFELELFGKQIPGDILAIERAAVLYDLCWFSLKAFLSNDTRISCCDLCCIDISKIVSMLVVSFVLCREVPLLFQKVARLLSTIYLIAAVGENISSSLPSCKVLSENYWAAYFHQASVGSHHNHCLRSSVAAKRKPQITSDVKASQVAAQDFMSAELCTSLRLAPESTENIEAFVQNFFKSLPCTSIVCISLLGGAYVSLLKELLPCHSPIHAWMLLSHLNAQSQPVVLLMPVDSVLLGVDDETSFTIGEENMVKQWHSPWGSTLVDDLAPMFKSLLKENYASSAIFPQEDTERNRSIWWMRRKDLDKHLCKLLRDVEELWFGQWKYLLLGQWLDSKLLNSIVKQLVHDLKVRFKVDVNESLLKVVLGTVKFINREKLCIPRLFLEKGCYIGRVGVFDQERYSALGERAVECIPNSVFESLLAAANKLEEEHCTNREQVILVLDSQVQMLPWENMPILREEEVYRMPSVGCISAALQRSANSQEEAQRLAISFPLIDPLDAFYLLNPSGDLSSTQAEFEEWFRAQNLQGKAGTAPTTEELSVALRSHDLYIYFGHGSGAQYIPTDEIQKLERCAATVLMGCSSGSLLLNGCYAPQGIAYSYILAGSPIVVANLWEVTDKDIDRFGKSLLKSWLDERSNLLTGCIQCSLLAEELKCMSMSGKARNGKKYRGKKPQERDISASACENCCRHKLKVGHFVSQARKACKLPFLIGAAPVCYGVPTGIRRKNS
ncbi:hypothetical protein Nepgr_029939 [Nepenthes gracilis]|uniref:separase n=1 Tax=Nepenthes gracilis TaxID=150966 RepID=A0AAD3Y622_NEPGR|nr:hypothetical protein Nepgr_029939 [Nepenthes gracilis]